MRHATNKGFLAVFCVLAALLFAMCLAGCSKAQIAESATDLAFEETPVTDQTPDDSSQEQTSEEGDQAAEEEQTQEGTENTEGTEHNATTEQTASGSGVIAIDAGHQGEGDSTQEPIGPGASETKARVTSGTTGYSTGIPESEITLAVALKLRDALEQRGFTVVMVRESQDVNISNSERAAVANDANASLFIRLHCDDTGESSVSGFYTLIPGENTWTSPIVSESRRAAEIMHPLIVAALGSNDRGITERTDLSGFNWCEVPTVLFEMGCMSNPSEDELLATDSYQQKMADAIADATVAYMNS